MPASKMTMGDLSEMLASGLSSAARRPNIYGYKPHEKQKCFHSKVAKHRLFLGGNRSGKSTAGVIEDIWWATGTHPYRTTPEPPVKIRVIGVDFPNGVEKILLPEFQRWVPITALKGDSWEKAYSKAKRTLYFKNGSFIEFMSADQELDKFAGTSRDLIHFDEEPPGDVWNENKARTIDTAGEIIMTMTPLLGLTWVYDDLYMKQNDVNFVVEVSMEENPFLSAVEVEAFLSSLSKDERKSRGDGKFVAIGGLILKDFSVETHVIDPVIPPLDWEWYMSLDHGINNPTAILWHAVSPEGQIITFSEHYASDLTVATHATTVHTREAGWGRVPDYRVCDPALRQRQALTGDSLILEYEKLGITLIPGNNDVASGIAKMVQATKIDFETKKPQWLITANCANLIREAQRYRYATYLSSKVATRSNKMETPVKKDDHALDAFRYFITFLPDLRPFQATNFPQGNLVPSNAPQGYDSLLWQSINNSVPQSKQDEWRYD